MYIPIILGTAREGRESEKVANYIYTEVKNYEGVETEIIDVRKFLFGKTIPSWEKNDLPNAWKAIAEKASGFIIVSPEYNHGFPGELKILLDSAYAEYNRKPVGIAAVSEGMFGGARGAELLIHVLRKLGLSVIRSTLYFGKVEELFSKDGGMKDASYGKRIEDFMKDIVWYAKALEYGRKNI